MADTKGFGQAGYSVEMLSVDGDKSACIVSFNNGYGMLMESDGNGFYDITYLERDNKGVLVEINDARLNPQKGIPESSVGEYIDLVSSLEHGEILLMCPTNLTDVAEELDINNNKADDLGVGLD